MILDDELRERSAIGRKRQYPQQEEGHDEEGSGRIALPPYGVRVMELVTSKEDEG